jgi:beta-propeller uncharacterized protein DUF5122
MALESYFYPSACWGRVGSSFRSTVTVAWLIGCTVTLGLVHPLRAASGSLGQQSVDTASAVVIQPDGKIVVAGASVDFCNGSAHLEFALARHNPDGIPDADFGTGGNALTSFASDSNDQAFAMALQSEHRRSKVGDDTVEPKP